MLICLSVVPTVYADVIDPDEKEVQTSYQIINLDSYPDYVFLLYGYPFLLFTLLFTILVESLVIWIFLRKKQKIAVILFIPFWVTVSPCRLPLTPTTIS